MRNISIGHYEKDLLLVSEEDRILILSLSMNALRHPKMRKTSKTVVLEVLQNQYFHIIYTEENKNSMHPVKYYVPQNYVSISCYSKYRAYKILCNYLI